MDALNATCAVNAPSTGLAQIMFTYLISTLIKSYCNINPEYPEDSSAKVLAEDEEYDFIIVGSGSAGSVIANRLSEISNWKILLIEAGEDPPTESNIPALWSILMGSKYDWKYTMESNENACRSMKNKQCIWAMGKMLGGSSSINGMFYVRGNPKDYDNWEKLGNKGWNYENVLKYFKKLESVNIDYSIKDAHGYDGYLNIEEYREVKLLRFSDIDKMVVNAAKKLGYPYIKDMAANVQSGVTNLWATMHNGIRSSTANAYLVPAKERKNLIIMKGTLVTKVLINKNKAYGVEVSKNGVSKTIKCKKEVILSAGTIRSPHLLMLSGIGPKEHLQQFGLPVNADLKVGYNVQDHIFSLSTFLRLELHQMPFEATDVMYSYLTKRTELGHLPISNILYYDTKNQPETYPDIQIHFFIQPPNNPLCRMFYESINIEPYIVDQIEIQNEGAYLLQFLPKILRPKSRGRIELNSADPFVPPKIFNNYLKEKEDVDTIIKGVKLANKMIETGSFKNATLFVPIVDECKNLKIDSDEYHECYTRNLVNTLYHASGSCKMGPNSDPDAVVDPRLKVYGIKGLRVADASIIPNIVSGNTNIPTIMIGEKASDLIKEDWLGEKFHSEL